MTTHHHDEESRDELELIEDLTEYKSVENQSLEFVLVIDDGGGVSIVEAEDLATGEMKNESDDGLENSLSDDHHPHLTRNKRSDFSIRLSVQRDRVGRIGGESESGEGTTSDELVQRRREKGRKTYSIIKLTQRS